MAIVQMKEEGCHVMQNGLRSGPLRLLRGFRAGRLAGSLTLAALALSGCAAVGFDAPGQRAGDTGNLPALLSLAERSEESGNHSMAGSVYEEAARRFPDSPEPHMGLARTAYSAGQGNDAVNHYRAALERAPESFEARYGMGKALLADDRLTAAAQQFDALIDQGTEDHRPYLARGVALDLQGFHADAQESYRAGLRNAPHNVPLQNNLGLSLALGGDHAKGLNVLEELTREPTAPARARQNLALVYGLAGQMESAAATAQQDMGSGAVTGNLAYYEALQDVQNRAQGSTNADVSEQTSGAAPSDGPVQLVARLDEPSASSPTRNDPIADRAPVPAASPVPEARTEIAEAEEKTQLSLNTLDSPTSNRLYWVQFASFPDSEKSESVWSRLQEDHADLLSERELSLHAAEIDGRGTFYRVRTGPFADAQASNRLCEEMQTRGQDCLTIRR